MYGIYSGGSLLAKFAAPMTIRSNHPVYASDTLSLGRKITRRAVQRWEIESNLVPLSTDANGLFVELTTKGYSEAVTVRVPQNYGVITNRTAETAVAAGTAGNATISVTVTGLIPKGTFIRSASHSKIYITTADRNGSGAVVVYPTPIASFSGNLYIHDDVDMICLFDLDTIIGMSYVDGILMDMGTVKLLEWLP